MKLAIILSTTDPEKAYNALRIGVTALSREHDVSLFLLGCGVEIDTIAGDEFNVQGFVKTYTENGGVLFGCESCLSMRKKEGLNVCTIASMTDLLDLVESADQVLCFS